MLLRFLLLIVCFGTLCDTVDRSKFKRCSQSSFCGRQRRFQPEKTYYKVLGNSVSVNATCLSAIIVDSRNNENLNLHAFTIGKGIFRIVIDERDGLRPRYRPLAALVGDPLQENIFQKSVMDQNAFLENRNGDKLFIAYDPFHMEVFKHGDLVLTVNAENLFNFERYTHKIEKMEAANVKDEKDAEVKVSSEQPQNEVGGEAKEFDRAGRAVGENEGYGSQTQKVEENANLEEGLWTEHFGTYTDSKPYGPSSIGLDINFVGFRHVYGIPEHADSLSLRDTNDTDPYRLYNLDVFEYETDNTMAVYGSAPYMIGHSTKHTVGVFWLNSAESWIDIHKYPDDKNESLSNINTHWMFEAGVVDLFILTGPKPGDVFGQYASLVGTAPLWPLFTFGHHVSRWNYMDTADVRNVDNNFDVYDIPYDSIWLDIEHTNGKRYFTWDPVRFAKPEEMIKNISAKGRKVVVVSDPHIKKDPEWALYKTALEKGFYVKDKDGNDYDGWCWPGASVYLDFFNPAVREWYADRHLLTEYPGSTEDLFFWNDMNEPAVFSGPEVTMPKDNIHYGGLEHREVHNIFCLMQHSSTYVGVLKRSNNTKRPFLLTRAFFSGSQRYATVWTGDNMAEWSHMKITTPMVLSLGLAGIAVSGADVGGFFKNPDEEMMTRWHQMGAFHPFYRMHSELNTPRREPWVYSEKTRLIIRDVLRLRYSLLPYWYTLLWEHTKTGWPIVRPLWTEFPDDQTVFAEEGQFMLGSALMVMPVVDAGVSSVNLYLPGQDLVWYDWITQLPTQGNAVAHVFTPIEKIPLFMRGGCIIPMRERIRRASSLTKHDPITLLIALDKAGRFANGTLYLDDGETFEYLNGKYLTRYFQYIGDDQIAKLTSAPMLNAESETVSQWESDVTLEKVVIMGLRYFPREVHLYHKNYVPASLVFNYDNKNMVLTIKKPSVPVSDDFQIDVHY